MKNKLLKVFVCIAVAGGITTLIPMEKNNTVNASGNRWDENLETYYDILDTETKKANGVETTYSIRRTTKYSYPVVTANICWIDSANGKHPLENHKVYFYCSNYQFEGKTNSDGYALHKFNGKGCEDNIFGFRICAENGATKVIKDDNIYHFDTDGIRLINNDWLHLNINIYFGESELTKAFEFSQASLIPYEYVHEMSNKWLDQIPIFYPDDKVKNGKEATNHYCNKEIHLTSGAYKSCWDTVGHEYGHYIDKEFNITTTTGGSYSMSPSQLKNEYGFDKTLGLTLGEGVATYFAMASQDYFPKYKSIPTVGDMKYGSIPYNQYEGKCFDSDFDVKCIATLLINLMDNDSDNGNDEVALGHKQMWEILTTPRSNNQEKNYDCIHSLVTEVLSKNEKQQEEIYKLLELTGFSSYFESKENIKIYSSNNDGLTLYWYDSFSDDNLVRKYNLLFKGVEGDSYTINGIKGCCFENSYSLNDEELNHVLNLSGNPITCKIETYLEGCEEKIKYLSTSINIEKPSFTNLSVGKSSSYFIDNVNYTNWFKFVCPSKGLYKIYSESYYGGKAKCVPYSKLSTNIEYRITPKGYNEKSNGTFEFYLSLETNEVIYLQVSSREKCNYGYYVLNIDNNHECSYTYSYDPMNNVRHWAYCICGKSKLEQHNFVTYKMNRKTVKICEECDIIIGSDKEPIVRF